MAIFNGRSWTLANFKPFEYVKIWDQFWDDVLAEMGLRATAVGASLVATSATSDVSIGTGAKTLVIQPGKGFTPGQWVVATDAANAANSITGPITSYDAATGALVITVPAGSAAGSGTPAGWKVGISGQTGPAGGVSGFNMRVGAVTPLAGDYPPSLIGAIGQGWHVIPLPASAIKPRITSGATSSSSETATNKILKPVLTFDAATALYGQVTIPMPPSANLSAGLMVQYVWEAASGSGATVMGARAQWQRDGDTIDSAWGTAVTVTDTFLGAGKRHISAISGVVTPAGTAGSGCSLLLEIYRDAANASDTLAVSSSLLEVRVYYSINAPADV
ncbi:hypothetical protein [Azospirillum agricola]|uniref:hypothetical protein n=1 Tax=Azospirillum agricola TaxID=1720247 RepID=UPI000A0EF9DD|nr:hypothetical protein [Azospirillum agricola]SMH29790.1 hypothetical protein SAMN02982994_0226 [Azospirillum lipoferum]